ncbi:phosphatase PAP2 family protein [Myxococcus sp. CA051A]|uniref:Phosphatase PAP2 family protein n=2 Tax=Myxococcaceae TaxID=31 RepID=A0A540WTX2_9BACT|nr:MULTISPECIES: phosphatase PAP2 family protein [Myxococcus]NTX13974.1 phosphatase PAP2 family protein [Myxococcus sp. CA056]NTX36769.1 phosphatase PAP2 family protein [Myxococcus sp. CA033]NTX55966.1 phosphatase PAP2 family protein [Myxococcus sp. CA039A]NTX62591.1 phosphatase PAP2 family protein [Myxococcus sp. CA051A]TQF12390.1 phosphatase PAP2 family protein [Myxococcus llanfairpwllgwyngyllgogerychwyrndrobwllllantysiliogogogochensis]
MNGPRDAQVRLGAVDLIIVIACSLGAFVLLGPGRWAPQAIPNAGLFASMAAGPLVLRTLESWFPRQRWLTVIADFWLLPVAVLTHSWLSPVVDTLNPFLRDAQLVAADQRIFGFQAAVVLAHVVPPWLNDVLMVCYYGHFVWPLVLGIGLYYRARGASAEFDEYLLGLGLLFILNYSAYSLVPAVGPRYFLVDAFSGPLQGTWTPMLDSIMRRPLFGRDCFPSGHTGTTLVVLFYSWRFSRKLFWVMLLPGLGLIVATLAGRFHYATDLLCAVPLVMVVVGMSAALSRAARQRESERAARSVPVDAILRP